MHQVGPCRQIKQFLLVIICFWSAQGWTQSGGGFEQYYFKSDQGHAIYTPIAYRSTDKDWYHEMRYNYDELETFSFYTGKIFSGGGALSYSVTPLVGTLLGKMNGGSCGTNFDAEYKKFSFSSQSQYSFSWRSRADQFFFNWTEVRMDVTPWFYSGLSFQQTNTYNAYGVFEPAGMIGFSWRQVSVPFYVFNPAAQERYFVIGLNWEWKNASKPPSRKTPSSHTAL